jgi:hypothetical protein
MEGAPVMKIRLIRPFRSYVRGTVLEVPGGQADEMIRTGVAVEEKQQDLLETAAVEAEVRTADATPKRKGRK